MVEHKLVAYSWSRNTYKTKIMPFLPLCCRAKLFCLKCVIPVTGLECSYGKIFIPVTEILVAKTKISVTGPAQPLILNTSIFFQRKEWPGQILETEPVRLTGLIWKGPQLWLIMWCPCYMRAMRSVVDRIKELWSKSWTSDPLCLNLDWNDPLLFVTGRWWCSSLAKMTKRAKIEKSKLFFVIPKIISVIPYPYNYLVSSPLSLKLFGQLSLIPKTPNRASLQDNLITR